MSIFYPTVLKNRITDITAAELEEMGVKALLLDVDNTLTAHHSQELSDAVSDWLSSMRKAGICLTIVSNAKYRRIKPFADRIGLPFIHMACKPLPFGFCRAVKTLSLAKDACAAVGDQTFTDVLGARLAGVRVIQLLPIEPENKWNFKWRRALEKGILRRFQDRQRK